MRRISRLPVIGGILVTILATGALTTFLGRTPTGGLPRVVLDRDSHNWGRVRPGSEVHTTFRISNRGGSALRLGEIKASCGCTLPKLGVSTLAPGGQTPLEIRFRVPDQPELVHHSVRIATSDPVRPFVELDLYAHSWLGVQPRPQMVDLGRLQPGTEVQRMVQLFSPDGSPFQVGHANSELPGLHVRVESPDRPLPIHRLLVAFHPGNQLGSLNGAVRITTNRRDAPYLDIPVVGEVTGPISVSPAMLQIDQDDIGKPVDRTLYVRSLARDQAMSLVSVTAVDPWKLIEQSVKPVADGGWMLSLTLHFPKGQGASESNLWIHLQTPEPIEWRVPLRIQGWTPPAPNAIEAVARAAGSFETQEPR